MGFECVARKFDPKAQPRHMHAEFIKTRQTPTAFAEGHPSTHRRLPQGTLTSEKSNLGHT